MMQRIAAQCSTMRCIKNYASFAYCAALRRNAAQCGAIQIFSEIKL